MDALFAIPIFLIAIFVGRMAWEVRKDRIEMEDFLRQRGYMK